MIVEAIQWFCNTSSNGQGYLSMGQKQREGIVVNEEVKYWQILPEEDIVYRWINCTRGGYRFRVVRTFKCNVSIPHRFCSNFFFFFTALLLLSF